MCSYQLTCNLVESLEIIRKQQSLSYCEITQEHLACIKFVDIYGDGIFISLLRTIKLLHKQLLETEPTWRQVPFIIFCDFDFSKARIL